MSRHTLKMSRHISCLDLVILLNICLNIKTFVATNLICLIPLVCHFMSRHSFVVSQHSFFPLQFFMLRHGCECLDKNCTAIFFHQCRDRAKKYHDILFQELLKQCRNIKIHCRDISALANFFAVFLAGFVSFTFKTCKTQSW